jgi:uncharacterized protein
MSGEPLLRATALVATAKPSPYLKQLCRHFGHRNEVSFDDQHGSIRLSSGLCTLEARPPDRLLLEASAVDAESLGRLTAVIGSHLERFGARDGLLVSWSGPAAAER